MYFNSNEKEIIRNALRQACYFVFVFAFVFGMHLAARIYQQNTFAENGLMENIQFGLLICSGFIFCLNAKLFAAHRQVPLLLASCAFLAACREQDKFLDQNLPLIS